MKRVLLTVGAALAASVSTPALAGVTIEPSKGQLSNQVNGDDRDDGNANTVFGRSDTGGEVKFTANTAVDITNGFASISDATPKDADFFSLVINPDEAFTTLDFSLQFLEATDFTIDFALVGGVTGTLGTLTQNSDRLFDFLISGTDGEVFDSVTITSSGSPIKLVKQVSFELAQGGGGTDPDTGAVPEPGTWAMMLLGFGGMGVAMRRRRRTGSVLPQAA
jgi:hypothetical protein